MTRGVWDIVDVSAYMDGQLQGEAHATLETALGRDVALRQEVTELRQVQQIVRALPLREPPRNYLLTPKMVAAPLRVPTTTRPALRWLRLLTSLTAALFVFTLGIQTFYRAPLPASAPPVTAPQTTDPVAFSQTTVEMAAHAPQADMAGAITGQEKTATLALPEAATVMGLTGGISESARSVGNATPMPEVAAYDSANGSSPPSTPAPTGTPSHPTPAPFPSRALVTLLGGLTLLLGALTYRLSQQA